MAGDACNNTDNMEYRKMLVVNFPYGGLQDFNPTDINQTRKALCFLEQICEVDLFYENSKAVGQTLDFTIMSLSNFQDMFCKDVLVKLLMLLKQIISRLTLNGKLNEYQQITSSIFDVLLYVSDLNIFCTVCSNISQTIIIELLKNRKYDYHRIDESLAGILQCFKEIKAHNDVNVISEIVLQKFPPDSHSYKLSAYWLMEESVHIVKTLNLEVNTNRTELILILRNITSFLSKVRGSIGSKIHMVKYRENIGQYTEELMECTPKLLDMCCIRQVRMEAKQLLGLLLQDFLNSHGMMSHDVESIIANEISEYPANIREWPKYISCTFFWICHLLYYYKRSVWSRREICNAISRLIYTKKYKRVINIQVMKSIFYVFAIIFQAFSVVKQTRILGYELLNSILPKFPTLLHTVLSLSSSQLFWIMYQGSWKMKISTVKFWLEKSTSEQLEVLNEILTITQSEKILMDILFTLPDSRCSMTQRIVEVIKGLSSAFLTKEIPIIIPQLISDVDLVSILIESCCYEIPDDWNLTMKLFSTIYCVTPCITNDNTLTIICRYAKKLLHVLRVNDKLIQSLCTNTYWIRFLLSRLQGKHETLAIAILELLAKIFKYQAKPNYSTNPIALDLELFFDRPITVVHRALHLLSHILRVKSIIIINEDHIMLLLYKLIDLTEISEFTDKAYDSLKGLLKAYPLDILDSLALGMLVEERCMISKGKHRSTACVKFILLWIRLVFKNRNKRFCFLPEERILRYFVHRSVGSSTSMVEEYMYFISEIYKHSDPDYDECDEENLIDRFNTGIQIC